MTIFAVEPGMVAVFCVIAAVVAVLATLVVVKFLTSNEEKSALAKSRKLLTEAEDNSKKLLDDSKEKAKRTLEESETKAKRLIEEAENKASALQKRSIQEGKEEILAFKREQEQTLKERKIELAAQENKVNQREQNIDRRDAALIEREKQMEIKVEALSQKVKDIEQKEALAQEKLESIEGELERVAQMSVDQAKEELFRRVEDKTKHEMIAYIKQKEEEAKEEAENIAKDLIGLAIDKYSQEVVSEKTISAVSLPSDEMKGRIIGREGRNIRTIESVTGVDLIIDDTPEAIVISSFDPLRREMARITIETLIKDGRIHPSRIE